jgi:phytoene synthase
MHASSTAQVRGIARRSRSSFYYAFLFLPREKREALDAVYSFCRLVDDAADEAVSPDDARARLAAWRRALDQVYGAAEAPDCDPVVVELRRAVRRFPIRRADLEAVIEGCEWDAVRTRYETWDELRAYCLRVASAVGLACIEIFGYTDERTRDYAVDLGIALQLTNIVRDVDEDAARGRIYLPREDLRAFGVDEAALLAGRAEPAPLERLLAFEAGRARLHFLRARATIGRAERDRLVVAEIMGDIYYALLERLERQRFPRRARTTVPTAVKAGLALRRYLAARLGGELWR